MKPNIISELYTSSHFIRHNNNNNNNNKATPPQALTGPDGSRRLRQPDFKTVGT
jgi:hypothetical protein